MVALNFIPVTQFCRTEVFEIYKNKGTTLIVNSVQFSWL